MSWFTEVVAWGWGISLFLTWAMKGDLRKAEELPTKWDVPTARTLVFISQVAVVVTSVLLGVALIGELIAWR